MGGGFLKKTFSVFLFVIFVFTFSITTYATSSSEGNALYQGLIGGLSAVFLFLLGLLGKLFIKIIQKPNEKARKVEEKLIVSKNNTDTTQKNAIEKINVNSNNENKQNVDNVHQKEINENPFIIKRLNYKNNFCRKCGAKLTEDAEFCHKCGTKVITFEDVKK